MEAKVVLEKQVEANAAHQEEREEDLERLGDEARLLMLCGRVRR